MAQMKKYKTAIIICWLVGTTALHAQIEPSSGMLQANFQGNAESKSQPSASKTEVMPPAQSVADPLFNPCQDCQPACRTGPWQQFWLRGGYSVWRMSDGPLAYPLLTRGNQPLGDPTTVVLYGNDKVDFDNFQGLTFTGGIWLDQEHLNGLGFGLQLFNTRSSSAFFSSNGRDGVDLSRPFIDSTQNLPFQNSIVQVSINDNVRSGSFSISNSAEIGGFDVHYLRNLVFNDRVTLNALVGYRFFQLKEHLDLVQKSTTLQDGGGQPLLLDNVVVPSLTISDSFQTKNQISGVEIGLQGEMNWGLFFVGGVSKVTLGNNRQTTDVFGSTSSGDTKLPGGMLALASNSGQDRENQFVIMPELNAYVGMQVTGHIRILLGYDWLYINNVVRPGNLINPALNQRYMPSSQFFGDQAGPKTPLPTMTKNDFIATGLSLSLEVQF